MPNPKSVGVSYEGHGESAPKPGVDRGNFVGIGTYAPLSDTPISADKKNAIKSTNKGESGIGGR